MQDLVEILQKYLRLDHLAKGILKNLRKELFSEIIIMAAYKMMPIEETLQLILYI